LRLVTQSPDSRVSIPKARRVEQTRQIHGDRRIDGYGWLRDVDDPDVLAYLAAERSFYDSSTTHLRPLVDLLASDMAARVPDSDSGVSYRRTRFVYYTRTPPGGEYEQLWRSVDLRGPAEGGSGSGERLLLDPAAEKGDSSYIELGVSLVSPDERLLAYSVDATGDEVYTLRFRDLEPSSPGKEPADLDDEITRSYYGGAWSADSQTFFYTVHDQAYRPCQVWRHRIGTPVADDVLVLSEGDEQYDLDVRATRSGDLVLIHAANRDTSEVWIVDSHHPAAAPRCVEPRRRGVEYACEHARTPAGDRLLVVTNDGAPEFRMMSTPLATPSRASWVELVPESPTERLYDVTAFAGHVVTTLRRDGVLMARSYRIADDGRLLDPVEIRPSFEAGTLEPAHNERFDTAEVQVVEESWTDPKAWYAVDLASGERRHLTTQQVPHYSPRPLSERAGVRTGGRGPGSGDAGAAYGHPAGRVGAVPAVRVRRLRVLRRPGVRRRPDGLARPGGRLGVRRRPGRG
jgi:oligopeptidase B